MEYLVLILMIVGGIVMLTRTLNGTLKEQKGYLPDSENSDDDELLEQNVGNKQLVCTNWFYCMRGSSLD